MNKEQSADDPSVDLIRVKRLLNSTISMSYPDVVIACIEQAIRNFCYWSVSSCPAEWKRIKRRLKLYAWDQQHQAAE